MRVVYDVKDAGTCGLIRCHLPAGKLNEHGLAEAHVIDNRLMQREAERLFADADIIVFQYPTTEVKFDAISTAHERGWKTVVEMDDNPYCVSPWNLVGYPDFGLAEYFYEEPDALEPAPLWVDVANSDVVERMKSDVKAGRKIRGRVIDIARNRVRLDRFTECLKRTDMVTCPVGPLAEVFRQHNKNVFVWPNCLDFQQWRPYKPEKLDDWIRIGWHGGVSHYEDWYNVVDSLKAVMLKYPKTRLVIFGSAFEGTLKSLPQDRIDRAAWCDTKMVPYVLAFLEIDIGICPLVTSDFNKCKSPLKWEEYGALAVPVVASNCQPYSDYIKNGKTGYLVSTHEGWLKRLGQLIEDADLRKKMGTAALVAVRNGFDADIEIHKLANAYKSIL